MIPRIRPENEPTKNAGTVPMTMIVLPSSGQLDGKADKCAYAWFTTQTEKRWKRTFYRFTLKEATCYTDEWQAYNHIIREHKTVCHAEHEWARDDDGDGIREVHTNTAEGM